MVKEMTKDNATFYVCEACGFLYREREWAERCQAFCEEFHSCNIEIMEHGEPPGRGGE
jgi:predicted ATP-dependent serine protease